MCKAAYPCSAWMERAGDAPLPGAGSVTEIGGRQDSPEIFYSFSSPLFPTTVFTYDPRFHEQTPFEAARPPVDVGQYETKAQFAINKTAPAFRSSSLAGRPSSWTAATLR